LEQIAKLSTTKKNFATQYSADNWTFIIITILMVNINKFSYWSIFKLFKMIPGISLKKNLPNGSLS